jgi:hypothetical protein
MTQEFRRLFPKSDWFGSPQPIRDDKAEVDAWKADLESAAPPGGSFVSRHVRQCLSKNSLRRRNANTRARFLLHKPVDTSGYAKTMDFIPKKQSC